MKASEIKLPKDGYYFCCKVHRPHSHYKFLMRLGRVFPHTKAQAKYFVSNGICLDVLNTDDVEVIESVLNKHGFFGEYRYTKSKRMLRLENNSDLHKALKKEYDL